MKNSSYILSLGLASLLALLVWSASAPAQMMGQFPGMMRPNMNVGGMRMPGLGNSAMAMPNFSGLPYSMPYPNPMQNMPYYASMMNTMSGYGYNQNSNYGAANYGSKDYSKKELPHRTGTLRSAPPDAGVIKIALPKESAEISMEGERLSSAGQTRFFVTPNLEKGKEVQYQVTAKWINNGQTQTQDRKVTVEAGKIAEVDFTKPEKAKETSIKTEGNKRSY